MTHGGLDFLLYGHRHSYKRQPDLGTRPIQKVQPIFCARRIGFQKESAVQGRELILQFKGESKITGEARPLKPRAQIRRDVGGDRDAPVTSMRHVA